MKDLDHILKLASVKIKEEDKQKFFGQIDDILGFISQLQEVDVEGIDPLTHPLEDKFISTRNGTQDFASKDNLIQFNVQHSVKGRSIVIKSPIKS